MTMLLDVTKRRASPYNAPLASLLCMREPATKRERDTDPEARATYLCCDPVQLEAHVQAHMWSMSPHRGELATPQDLLNSMLAFTSTAAVCGCDFTVAGLKGSRFDHMWESMPDFVQREPDALARFSRALHNDATVARGACQGLYRICVNASLHMETKPYYKKQSQSVFEVSDTMLRRAVWSAAYWAQHEFCDDMLEWGFHPPPREEEDAAMQDVGGEEEAAAPFEQATGYFADARPPPGPVVRSCYFG